MQGAKQYSPMYAHIMWMVHVCTIALKADKTLGQWVFLVSLMNTQNVTMDKIHSNKYIYIYVCVCIYINIICICVYARVYVYIYIYMCVYLCVKNLYIYIYINSVVLIGSNKHHVFDTRRFCPQYSEKT